MNPPSSKIPQVSVIIPSYNPRKTIENCLLSLERQGTDEIFEVIVVDGSSDGTAEFVKEKFPRVRLFSFPQRKSVGEARNIGIRAAQGEIIATLDADCIASKNWIEEIILAHRSLDPAIGGAIGNGNPHSYVGWAAYFTEFSKWMPKTPLQEMTDIAGCNMSYKKNLLKEFGPFIEGSYCSDTQMHWRFLKKGIRLRFVPSILVHHCNIEDLKRFLTHEFSHGRFFGRMRVKEQNFSCLRRGIYVILFPLIFLKLFLGVSWTNMKNRVYLYHFLRSLPLSALGLLLWSLGEAAGYFKVK